jgi:hypothetical protein
MDISQIVASGKCARKVQTLAQQFRLDEAQARAALDLLAPGRPSGDHARYLEDKDSGVVDDCNTILGYMLLGGVSRGVAAHAATAFPA